MAVLLENRTISMILKVPDVDVVPPSSTPIIERLDRSDTVIKHDQTSDSETISSMPVYKGSIVRIEQHRDDQNVSDLIIRVPNFQRLSSPSSDTDSKSSTRIKRRAPICPLLYAPTPNIFATNNAHQIDDHSNLSQTRVEHINRLTKGLRSLSRAFTHGCRSKRSMSSSEATTPSVLPDIEIINEKVSNKTSKYPIPKLHPPRILSLKRKKQPVSSSVSNETQTDLESKRINLTPASMIITTQYAEVKKIHPSPRVTSFLHRFVERVDSNQETNTIDDEDEDEDEQQKESIRLSFDVEQQFAAISQLVSDHPVSSIDAESLSTHRYSTISANAPDIRASLRNYDREDAPSPEPLLMGTRYNFDLKPPVSSDRSFRVQTSTLQPDISVVRVGTSNLTSGTDRLLPGEKPSPDSTLNIKQEQDDEDQIEHGWYGVIHPDDETFAECYEIIYQMDSCHQNEKEQQTDQSSVGTKIIIDPFEYKNLTSTVTTSESRLNPHEYEQIQSIHQNDGESQRSEEREQNLEHLETISKEQNSSIPKTTRQKSRSFDDLSRTSFDQTSTFQPESITDSSTSEVSPRHCTLHRSDSYNGFGIHISTDIKTRREHFIREVETASPGDQAGLKENDRILCINGTPVVQEDYTVVLQLIKHGSHADTLDFEVITNDAYEQFKSEIDQLYH